MSQAHSKDTSTQPAVPQNDAEGAMARLRRTVNEASESAKSYLGQLGGSSSTSQPSTPMPHENSQTTNFKSGTPELGDGFRKPTAFERFDHATNTSTHTPSLLEGGFLIIREFDGARGRAVE